MTKKKRVGAEETSRGRGQDQEELEQLREVATRKHLSNAMSKREHKKKVKESTNTVTNFEQNRAHTKMKRFSDSKSNNAGSYLAYVHTA